MMAEAPWTTCRAVRMSPWVSTMIAGAEILGTRAALVLGLDEDEPGPDGSVDLTAAGGCDCSCEMAVLTFWLTMAFTLLILSEGFPEMRMFVTTRAAIVAATTTTASTTSRSCRRPPAFVPPPDLEGPAAATLPHLPVLPLRAPWSRAAPCVPAHQSSPPPYLGPLTPGFLL